MVTNVGWLIVYKEVIKLGYIKKDNILKLEEFKQYLEDNYDGEVSLESSETELEDFKYNKDYIFKFKDGSLGKRKPYQILNNNILMYSSNLEDNKKCNSLIKKIKQIITNETTFNTVECEKYFYEQLIRIIIERQGK